MHAALAFTGTRTAFFGGNGTIVFIGYFPDLLRRVIAPDRSSVAMLALLSIELCLTGGCSRVEEIRFLPPAGAANWIRYPNPPSITAHLVQTNGGELRGVFRRTFILREKPAQAALQVRALESVGVEINGDSFGARERQQGWKQVTELEVASALRIGTNEIVATVTNRAGPPLLWLKLNAGPVEIISDTTWESSFADAVWQKAHLANDPQPFRAGNPMFNGRTIPDAVRRTAFTAATLFLLALVMTMLARHWLNGPTHLITPREFAAFSLAGFIVLWCLLFLHNVNQMGPSQGFDTVHHVKYIKFIESNHALPKSGEGWETHQPPLYYLVAAAVLQLFQWDAQTLEGLRALRLLSMIFGIGQILLVFASLRLLFPNEFKRPLLGTAMATFLPAHIYHAHYVTNETFFGLLVSGVFYFFLRVVRRERFDVWLSLALGVCLGAALLAKLTGLIIALVLLLTFAVQVILRQTERFRWIGTAGIAFGACCVVSGWYYWTLWKSGGPWNDSRWAYGLGWWQEDGYRTAKYYLRFGESLVRPLYSGFHSFWDGIYSTLWGDGLCGGSISVDYRPPWEYDLLALGYWLSLVPTLAVIAGLCLALRTVFQRRSVEWSLLLGASLLFALALLYFSLIAPGTSQVRASFGLMLMVPFCAMFAAGLGYFADMRRRTGLVVMAFAIFWGLNSFCAHWVPRTSSQPHLARAKWFFENGVFENCAREAEEGLRREPSKATLRSILADCFNQLGKTNEAKELVQEALVRWPNDPVAHLDVGFEHARAGRLDEAIAATRRAIALAPDDAIAAQQLVALLLQARRLDEAEAACREALRISPYESELHRRLDDLEQRRMSKESR